MLRLRTCLKNTWSAQETWRSRAPHRAVMCRVLIMPSLAPLIPLIHPARWSRTADDEFWARSSDLVVLCLLSPRVSRRPALTPPPPARLVVSGKLVWFQLVSLLDVSVQFLQPIFYARLHEKRPLVSYFRRGDGPQEFISFLHAVIWIY